MQITEVRVKLVGRKDERLKAFCSVTFDGDFVVRDVKVIEGTNGLFVAMPSRRITDRCPMCRNKNSLRARFCSECGARLDESRASRDGHGRLKLHVDIAHPVNAACRQAIEQAIFQAYGQELKSSSEPGYMPQLLHGEDEDYTEESAAHPEGPDEKPAQDQVDQAQDEQVKKDSDDNTHTFGQGIL
ncbi:MAG: zinc-ribbon domain-containing protein [Actinobacteria bacterium]|nr:zinc-ribbon domain-containing protein [Actinomycetota bacterium]